MMARVTTLSIVLAAIGILGQSAAAQQYGGGFPQAPYGFGQQPGPGYGEGFPGMPPHGAAQPFAHGYGGGFPQVRQAAGQFPQGAAQYGQGFPQDFSYYGAESVQPGNLYNASMMQGDGNNANQNGNGAGVTDDGFYGDIGYQMFPNNTEAPTSTWLIMETLLWKRHERAVPAVLTSSPPPTARNGGPLPPIAAVAGMPTTSILFGGGRVGRDLEVGGNTEFGVWLDTLNEIGVGGRFWIMDDEDIAVNATSTGPLAILGIPFFNTAIGLEDALLVGYPNAAFPPVTSGSVNINMSNEIHGAEGFLRLNLLYFDAPQILPGFAGRQRQTTQLSFDALTGYQYNRINDLITITGQFNSLPFMATPATTNIFSDTFRTKNKFHGGLLGIAVKATRGRWSLKGTGKIGVGNMRQTALVSGFTATSVGGVTTTKAGGLFTQTTNIGNFKRDHFAYVPEAQVRVGFQLTDNIRLTSGIDFIYWSNVLLAANQIDRRVDRGLLTGPVPGATNPAFTFKATDFWALGGNFGFIGEF